MARENPRDMQARRAAMERTKVRGGAKEQDEKKKRKQQLRLERQEQRLADRLERQNNKDRKKSPASSESPKAKGKSWDEKIKSFVRNNKRRTHKEKENDFQVIIGTKRKGLLRIASVVAVFLVIAVVLNSFVPISLWESVQNVVSSVGKGDGFPVMISPSNTNYIVPVGNDVALLGDSSLTLYKSNGKILFQRKHGFVSPAISSCSSRIMVYDRGGKKLQVENRAKTVLTMETEQPITATAMANNGTFGVITKGEVNTYNAKGKWQFRLPCAGKQMMALALSDNGRYLGLAEVTVENGQEVTVLHLIDTRRAKTLAEKSYQGCMPVSVDMKGNKLTAILNDRVVSVSKSGKDEERLFEGGTLLSFDNQNDYGAVLVLAMYQDSHNNRLLVVDKNLKEMANAEVNQEVFGVSAKGNRIALLLRQKIGFYSRGGKLKGEEALTADGSYLVCEGNYAVVLGNDTLQAVYR